MQYLKKLDQLRTMVDIVDPTDDEIKGIWHVQIQAGYPPTPFPRWQAKDADINVAYERVIDLAIDYWTRTRTGYSSNHDMVTVPRYRLDDAH